MTATTIECRSLQALHQRNVAVRFAAAGIERLLKGRAVYERDHALGQTLRIDFPSEDGAIVLAEDKWDGQITPGDAVGCEYLIQLR